MVPLSAYLGPTECLGIGSILVFKKETRLVSLSLRLKFPCCKKRKTNIKDICLLHGKEQPLVTIFPVSNSRRRFSVQESASLFMRTYIQWLLWTISFYDLSLSTSTSPRSVALRTYEHVALSVRVHVLETTKPKPKPESVETRSQKCKEIKKNHSGNTISNLTVRTYIHRYEW